MTTYPPSLPSLLSLPYRDRYPTRSNGFRSSSISIPRMRPSAVRREKRLQFRGVAPRRRCSTGDTIILLFQGGYASSLPAKTWAGATFTVGQFQIAVACLRCPVVLSERRSSLDPVEAKHAALRSNNVLNRTFDQFSAGATELGQRRAWLSRRTVSAWNLVFANFLDV